LGDDAPVAGEPDAALAPFLYNGCKFWRGTMAGEEPTEPKRPKGRTLAEFLDNDGKLPPAEQELLEACASGGTATIADTRPDQGTKANSIRAAFVRFLALGGDRNAAVHEHGVRVKGAWIDGDLDLESCRITVELTISSCTIDGTLVCRDADLLALVLNGSVVAGISADRVRCGVVALTDGFHAKGPVQLDGARIVGDIACDGGRFSGANSAALSCDGVEVGGHVFLRNGFQATGEVRLLGADIGLNLECTGGEFKGRDGVALLCREAKIGGSALLNKGEPKAGEQDKEGFHANGEVQLDGARIDGTLYCNGGQFCAVDRAALNCDGAKVGGYVFLNNGFQATGEVRLLGAEIALNLECTGGEFKGRDGKALLCREAKIGGSALLDRESSGADGKEREGFRASGIVQLTEVRIAGDLNCTGGQFRGGGESSLTLDGAEIKGSVYLKECSAEGAVRLSTANIAGNLECSKAHIEGWITKAEGAKDKRGWALFGDQAKIGGSVFLDDGFSAKGVVRLLVARIGGNLGCTGHIEGTAEGALLLDGAEVKGDLNLNGKFSAKGAVQLSTTNIGGNIWCNGGSFEAWSTTPVSNVPNAGLALFGDQAKVGGSVFLNNGFQATGIVRLNGAAIASDLACTRGRFDGGTAEALSLEQASIGGHVFLNNAFHAKGAVLLTGTQVGGNLDCERGHFDGRRGYALVLERAQVDGYLVFRHVEQVGMIDLTTAQVGTLLDDLSSWEKAHALFLDGFRYGGIAGDVTDESTGGFRRGAPTDAKSRKAWLAKQALNHREQDFRPQPWLQLARVLREMGHADEARAVAVAYQEQLRRAGKINWVGRIPHWVYGRIYGYGYRPARLFLTVIIAAAIFGVIYDFAGTIMVPTDRRILEDEKSQYTSCKPDRWTTCEAFANSPTPFNPHIYSFDLIVPIANLGQAKEWTPTTTKWSRDPVFGIGWPTGWIIWGLTRLENLFGWAVSLLFVGVVSGLIKKD
jgi:sRNA-binding regulator protein Hfq